MVNYLFSGWLKHEKVMILTIVNYFFTYLNIRQSKKVEWGVKFFITSP